MPRFGSSRALVLVAGALVLVVGVGAAAVGLVPRALEVRDYERDVAGRFQQVASCHGTQECSAAATAERVTALRTSVAAQDVSSRLAPIQAAFVDQLEAEATFWRLQAARKAGSAVSPAGIDQAEDAMVSAGTRRGELVEATGGPLLRFVEDR